MQRHQPQDIAVRSVVKADLIYGAMRSNNPASTITKQNLFLNQSLSLPFDDQSASIYGRIRAQLTMMGTPIGPNDLMITSIALSRNLILVTHNTSEFGRVQGLSLEDWETAL